MDAHNNRIGARIGATAGSWNSMQQATLSQGRLAAIRSGAIDAHLLSARSAEQITWLAPHAWQERLY
ncbi:hypothetical protein [Lysobacter sp. TAF61]|uniref:hypothetical protein n=1 Tax=Lysobacter sp. TAF61 TaxID=3233072 RepID=UPI003F97372A